jgi:hypothetical protein
MADPQQVEIIRAGAEKWNRWRTDNDDVKVNLSGADLSKADLIDVDLRRADLRRADLSGADLFEADLRGADLRRADLGGAILSGANLSWADLGEAEFSGAHLWETVFGNSNLTDAKGLDTCRHHGPSTLDHRTVAQAAPAIGCTIVCRGAVSGAGWMKNNCAGGRHP